jgi:hypothetical protein
MTESVQHQDAPWLGGGAPVVANINNATLNQAAPFLIIVKKVQLKLRSATNSRSVDGP